MSYADFKYSASSDSKPYHHTHLHGLCPVTGQSHTWCPAQPGDSRSPCPALNTLANHGYLPRNGKNIGMSDIAHALIDGYGLTYFFSWFLTLGGFFLIKQWGKLSLSDFARHDRVEHDASLVHHDADLEAEYAPCHIDDRLVDAFISSAKTPRDGGLALSAEDLGRYRVQREKASSPLDPVHSEIARGEMAIAFGLFGGLNGHVDGIPAHWLREWIQDERMPTGWKPTHRQDMFTTVKASKAIREAMKKFTEEDDAAELLGEPVSEAISDSASSIGDSASTAGDSLFISTATHETTPPTSDSEEETPVVVKGKDRDLDAEY